MPTSTTNYQLQKPLVNSAVDQDLWGSELNDDLDDIDTLLRVGITVTSQSSQTSSFTADASISVKKLYPCDATGGAFNCTIPSAATAGNGATVFVKKTDSSSNAVTLLRSASDTIDGATSIAISIPNSVYGLVSDGVSKWLAISIYAPVNVSPKGQQVITSGSGNFTTPADTISTTRFKFTLTGGGGGGGGSNNSAANGGGAGSTAIYYISGLTALLDCAYSIGIAGAAGTPSGGLGGDGGDTTLIVDATTITAPGGHGGAGTNNGPAGLGGGAATNATISIPGGDGHAGGAQGNSAFSGNGAASFWGGGGRGRGAAEGNQPGHDGQAPGSGGGGGYNNGGSTQSGGAGKAGILLVEWD